jgi:hypothetical protein
MGTFEALEGWQGLDRLAGLPHGEADLIKALQIQPEFHSISIPMDNHDPLVPPEDRAFRIAAPLGLPQPLQASHPGPAL